MKINNTKFNNTKFNNTKINITKKYKMLTKNINLTNNMIIIILVALLIVLGVYWWYKQASIIEGAESQYEQQQKDTENAEKEQQQKNKKLMSGLTDIFADAGVNLNDNTQTQALMNALKDELGATESGIYDLDRMYAEASDDLSSNLINTIPETYPGKTFLIGGRDNFNDGFCETYGSKPELDFQCNKLTAEHCNQTDCCVFLNGGKCVAGSKDGPDITVNTVTGIDIDYTYYSHKNTCYGSCGKGLSQSANPCSGYSDESTSISKDCIKRYWKQTVCGEDKNNPDFITDEIVAGLNDYSRKAIKQKIKDIATNENHLDKCYGLDQSKWPEPCYGTTPTSFGLSQRCLTHLFKESGCSYTGTVNQAFVDEHQLEPKSAIINKFAGYFNGKDVTSNQKCYGFDDMGWPNPCANVPDNTPIADVPKQCILKTWRDLYKGQCNTNYIEELYDENDKLRISNDFTLKNVKETSEEEINNTINHVDMRYMCHGSNPNNWPTIEKVSPDPCKNIKSFNTDNLDYTKLKDIPIDCRNRISDILAPNNNVSAQQIAELKSQLRDKKQNDNYYISYLQAIKH